MSDSIYVRVCLIVMQADRILLVPHFDTDSGPIQYNVPGGGLEFGEGLEAAALREFEEETGFMAQSNGLFDIFELHKPDWHSITVAYSGIITGGAIRAEQTRWGERVPRWFTVEELKEFPYHPMPLIDRAFTTIPRDSNR